MADLTRRDFLKILSIAPMAALVQRRVGGSRLSPSGNQPNIIVLVFDAWSADHMSLYGYPRQTMPNVEQFAENAIVYHRHYSAGTFTVPGTASLLTGLYPWSHRALELGGEMIASRHSQHQIFHALSPTHSTLGYGQNQYADLLLLEMNRDLDRHVSVESFNIAHSMTYNLAIFRNDPQVAHASFENDIFQKGAATDGSLFVGPLRRLINWRATNALDEEYNKTYPRGLPSMTEPFRMEDVVDGTIGILRDLPKPSLAYLHLFPPHAPYRPKAKYNSMFRDGWEAPEKPIHALTTTGAVTFAEEENDRLKYDQYLASWDAEVGRLLDHITNSGLLDSSYIMLTSDHGELFERGVVGHFSPLIYDPIVHLPLIISRPGQKGRIDIQTATSSVDLLPTIASLGGGGVPDWAEGQLLPEFGGSPAQDRSIYAMDAKTNSVYAPLTRVSIALVKGNYRLTYYQYPVSDYRSFELYDLAADPDELKDLYPGKPQVAVEMQEELLQKLEDVNRPFTS